MVPENINVDTQKQWLLTRTAIKDNNPHCGLYKAACKALLLNKHSSPVLSILYCSGIITKDAIMMENYSNCYPLNDFQYFVIAMNGQIFQIIPVIKNSCLLFSVQ